MTREQQLESCKVCKHQKYDHQQGIICRHTNSIATFQDECELFEVDLILKEAMQKKNKDRVLTEKTVGAGTRLANYILDYLFIMAAYIFFFIIIIVIANVTNSPTVISFEDENMLLLYLITFLINMFYFTLLETLTGRTMAKLITRTKVVAENGEKASLEAILIRSLCRFIPFDAFSFLGEDARGWHDTLSKTRVISVK